MLSFGSRNAKAPLFFYAALLSIPLAITGCTFSPTSVAADSNPPTTSTFGAIAGVAHGGQQPIVGGHIYLMAAGISGYGAAATSLLNNVPGQTTEDASGNYYATTSASGSFNLGGAYSCTPGTQVYIYSSGGDPGDGSNSGAGLLATLGECPAAGNLAAQVPYLNVNEVSTVATAFAIAGFAVDPMHVAHSGTTLAATGIANAFANVSNIINIGNGYAYTATPAGNGTVPQTRINTLANILAACINSSGVTSAQCTTLFAKATIDGTSTGTKPADTAAAAINIAHFPSTNVSNLFNLQQSIGAPFAPALITAPTDFTLSLTFTGGGMSTSPHLAVDANGNVWTTPDGSSVITELSPLGVALSGSSGITGTGLQGSKDIAIDANNNAVALGSSSSTFLFITTYYGIVATVPNGTTSGTSASFVSEPKVVGMGLDSDANVYYVDALNNELIGVSETGGLTSSHIGGGISADTNYTALDGSGNIWATNANNSLSKFSAGGGAISLSGGFTGGGLDSPRGLTFDSGGNAWTANYSGNSLSEFNSSGTAVSGTSGYTGGGLNHPVALSADGLNHLWVANATGNSISEFNASNGAALTGTSAITSSGLSTPNSIAVDGSGNVWVGSTSAASLTEFLGAAAPVVTPLAAAVKNNTLATRP